MDKNKVNYVLTDNSLTVIIGFVPKVIDKSHINFDRIKTALKNNETEDVIKSLISVTDSLKEYSNGNVEISNGVLYYKGVEIHSTLTNRIISMYKEGFNVNGMVLFLTNLYKNPSKTAIDELYLFLESCKLPITEDGHFLAYKKVRNDYKDIHSGTFDNSIGARPSMERNEVCDDRRKTCSQGLHFASFGYMKSFGNNSDNRIVIVKINPADVVSIPEDYNNAKGRCWTYEVVNEIENDGKSQIKDDCITDKDAYKVPKEKPTKPTISEAERKLKLSLKELKDLIVKNLYSGTLTIQELYNELKDINSVSINELQKLNYNQVGNYVRECLIKDKFDLIQVNGIIKFINNILDEKDGSTIDTISLKDVINNMFDEKQAKKIDQLSDTFKEAIKHKGGFVDINTLKVDFSDLFNQFGDLFAPNIDISKGPSTPTKDPITTSSVAPKFEPFKGDINHPKGYRNLIDLIIEEIKSGKNDLRTYINLVEKILDTELKDKNDMILFNDYNKFKTILLYGLNLREKELLSKHKTI